MGSKFRWWLACAITLAFSTPSLLFAQGGPKPKLFMLPTQSVNNSTSSIIPERIGEQVRQGVQQDGSVVLMPSYDEIQKQLGASGQSSAAIAEAEQLYTSGIGLLTAGEDKQAAETFQRAVDIMEANIADISNFNVLADALSNLSLAYHNAGFDLDARKRMKFFAQIEPNATLDPEKFPKELIEIYEDEARKIKKGGPGKLEITANVDGARVFIDGVEKGATPVTVEDVGFGHHYLVVRAPAGDAIWAEKIRVKGRKKSQNFKAELGAKAEQDFASKGEAEEDAQPTFYGDLKRQVASGRFGTDLQPYLKELTTQTGAEFVAWVLMYKEGSDYRAAPFVYRASDGLIAQGDGVSFNIELSNLRVGVSELSTTIVELVTNTPEDAAITEVALGPAPVVTEPTPTEPSEPTDTVVASNQSSSPYEGEPMQPPPEVPPSESSNTWTYVAIGGGALAVAGGIALVLLLSADGDNPQQAGGFTTSVSW